jgi:RHS repeat-associated protein
VTHLADYAYLGRGDIIQQVSPQPGLMYTLIGIAGGNDPITGDIYRGLDSFGRVKDLIWLGTGAGGSSSSSSGPANILERVQHGYDRASNRLYRAEPVDPSDQHDEFYDYDAIYRLKDFQRGSLNTTKTGIAALTFAQCWNLDEAGNWTGFREDDNGDGLWDLMQNRASNRANEISLITESVGPSWITPAHDKAGNMTTMPQPASPTLGYGGTYDAWNRLVKLTAGGVTVATYAYDGLNRRGVANTYSGSVLAETRHFFFSHQWQVVEDRVGASIAANRQFVWGTRYVDNLVLRDRDTTGGGSLNERLYALQDGNWNITAIADAGGNIQERFAYSSYGMPFFLSPTFGTRPGSDFVWDRLFGGYCWELDSSLYLVRNRVYHGLLGVWLQRDFFAGTNLNRYAGNRPSFFVDPSGAFVVECVVAAEVATLAPPAVAGAVALAPIILVTIGLCAVVLVVHVYLSDDSDPNIDPAGAMSPGAFWLSQQRFARRSPRWGEKQDVSCTYADCDEVERALQIPHCDSVPDICIGTVDDPSADADAACKHCNPNDNRIISWDGQRIRPEHYRSYYLQRPGAQWHYKCSPNGRRHRGDFSSIACGYCCVQEGGKPFIASRCNCQFLS